MLAAFWQAIGGKLADRFAAVSVPALVFWLTVLAAWTVHRRSLDAMLAGRACRRRGARLAGSVHAGPAAGDPTAKDLAVYTRLERRRRRRPSSSGYFMPTPIGNILRAAERRPFDKYGLDAVVLWPRVWPLLPDTLRSDLLAARASLDRAAIATVWGVLFCAFAPLTLWAIPTGLVVAATAVAIVIPDRAQVFGDLIEAAYDQYRTTLYSQLRWPLPANPKEERVEGHRLTSYLLRGSNDTSPTFIPPAEPAPDDR